MGSILDEDYKVNGVKQLRAVDSSTFEESQGTKPTATVLRFSSSYNFDQKKKKSSYNLQKATNTLAYTSNAISVLFCLSQ